MKYGAILFALILLLTPPSWAANSGDDLQTVTLNSQTTIDDDVIRLGDIFQGTGKLAERVVAYGPKPGGRAVFDARWLYRVAAAFKLDWRPLTKSVRLVVERSSEIVTTSEVEDLLHDRLVAEGGDPSSQVVLSNNSFTLHLPVGQEYLLGVESLSYDQSKGRFSATLAWGSGKNDRRRVVGRFVRMTEVPVLAARKMRGDIIAKGDLNWIEMPGSHLSRNTITDASRLIGKAAKRSIAAGKPVSLGDVRQPLMVKKGESITMRLSTPAMQLTAKGKALQEGGKGDTIRISNSQTSTVVEGTVIGPGLVRIDTPVNLAMR